MNLSNIRQTRKIKIDREMERWRLCKKKYIFIYNLSIRMGLQQLNKNLFILINLILF